MTPDRRAETLPVKVNLALSPNVGKGEEMRYDRQACRQETAC
jgi:hypothetical protein